MAVKKEEKVEKVSMKGKSLLGWMKEPGWKEKEIGEEVGLFFFKVIKVKRKEEKMDELSRVR